MAVTHYDLTATFTDLLGTAYSPTSAKVVAWIETNVASSEGIVDEIANSIQLGGSRQVADSSGNVTWTNLVGSDSDAADINLESGTLQYRVTAEYVDAITRRRKTWVSGWFSLTADIDLADVVAETYVPAAWMTTATATLQTYVDAGQAAATTASAAATTASGAANTAVNAAGLASEIAMGDGGAALAAADLDPGSAFRLQNDPRMAATYIPRNGTDPGEAGFWADRDPGAKIARVRDRIFVGDAAALPGNYTAAEGSTGEYFPFSRWMARESTAVVASGIGRVAVTGLSRATLSPTTPAAAPPAHTVSIGVVGFSYSDVLETESATRVVNGWGGYFEGVKRSGGQATFGVEIDVGNLGGGTATNNPYTMFGAGGPGGTYGLVVASGGSTGLAYEDTTFGIAVTNNGAKTKVGLLFAATAITGTDGVTGTGSAIQMAKGHLVQWLTPESGGPEGASIYSSVTLNASRTGMEFANDAVKFSRAGATVFRAGYNGGSDNYASALSSATGQPVVLIAGSDTNTNVGLRVGPKGTSDGNLTGGAGASKVGWNDTGVGFFATAPIAKRAATADATDLATAITLVNAIKADLVAYGLKTA